MTILFLTAFSWFWGGGGGYRGKYLFSIQNLRQIRKDGPIISGNNFRWPPFLKTKVRAKSAMILPLKNRPNVTYRMKTYLRLAASSGGAGAPLPGASLLDGQTII